MFEAIRVVKLFSSTVGSGMISTLSLMSHKYLMKLFCPAFLETIDGFRNTHLNVGQYVSQSECDVSTQHFQVKAGIATSREQMGYLRIPLCSP